MSFAINSDAVWTSSFHKAKLEGDIMVVENALSSEDCKKFIAAVKDDMWNRAVTAGEGLNGKLDEDSKRFRKSDIVSITGLAQRFPGEFKRFDDVLWAVFNSAQETYSYLIGERFAVDQDEGYSMLRYGKYDEYKYHADNGAASTGTLRTLSVLLYLNDDYQGGEIDFPRQKFRLKPKAGTLVMFPAVANYRHASLPITEGTKYTIVTWYR